jgi:hypothetical protein
MAGAALSGSASISYASVTFPLAVPLQEVRQVFPRQRFEFWSADARTRETVLIEGGAADIEATIRCDNDPEGLVALVRYGLESNGTFTYQRVTDGDAIPFVIVSVIGAQEITLDRDPDRFGFGEWMIRLRLRRIDGGNWAAVL